MKKPTPKQLLNLQAQHERPEMPSSLTEAIIALDYGEKFCGLALAPDGATALPSQVVETSQLSFALNDLINQSQAKILVVGLPISSDGSENHICAKIRTVVDNFKSRWPDLSIELINERFSTQATLSPDKARIDDLAALQILTFYLQQK